MKRFVIRMIWVPALLLGSACASAGPNYAAMTPEQVFEQAQASYQAGKWSDAISAFERFVLTYPTHPRVQEARFKLADSYFGKKEYITSAAEFARLSSEFPAGPYADDARFKVCESYERLSPKPALDQQYTRAAIEHCQSLETYYPSSDYVPRAREITIELTNRLGEKAYEGGEFYYKRKAYDSAIVYFERAVREYPTTIWAPRALLRLYQTYTTIGYQEEAAAAKAKLIADYPGSPEAKTVQGATVDPE